jgi:ABC-type uncharacterized transport system involved in gliding motility auxiliary subunit
MARNRGQDQSPKVLDETTIEPERKPLKPQHQQTVGEIAYNTYCGARNWKALDGSALPEFKAQQQDVADAWELAGNAVRRAVESDEFFTSDERSEFKIMVREKQAAGLTKDQAEAVARTEIESQKRSKLEQANVQAPEQETAKA